jgi:hypothetical protein
MVSSGVFGAVFGSLGMSADYLPAQQQLPEPSDNLGQLCTCVHVVHCLHGVGLGLLLLTNLPLAVVGFNSHVTHWPCSQVQSVIQLY